MTARAAPTTAPLFLEHPMILTFPTRSAAPPRPSDASKSLDGRSVFEHPSGMEASDLISTAAVCRLYGVTRGAVRLWVADGLALAPETPTDPATGRPIRFWFRAADVAAYVEARKAAGRWGEGKRGKDKAPRQRGRWQGKDANEGAAA